MYKYYFNCFFIYSILGYILETLFALLFNFNYESGILYGPWAIVYGIGSVIIILFYEKVLKNIKINKFIKALILFISMAIILSLIEFVGGILIEKIFHTIYWDYSDYKFSIGKYISLEMSLVWGIGSVILIYLIKPLFDKIIKKIPYFITCIFIIGFVVDIILTLIFKSR